jgi:hypothetical protein
MNPATAVKVPGRLAPTMVPGTMTGLQAIFHHPKASSAQSKREDNKEAL